ncbi:SAM domain and HD [Bulinus truncatus]|nr:SAM domain and HD [Bulinus truncatus]
MMAGHISHESRLYNDPVHGHIKLNPTCQLFVDTKEFQRLRYIKQLGVAHYVFTGATHTRFEHSLGTCHLAGKFARSLKEKHPEISDKDILCIEIAALCHDLGCAPYSKFFFERYLPQTEQTIRKPNKEMFNFILDKNEKDIKKKLEENQFTERDFWFIEEMIDRCDVTGSTAWPYKGRDDKKAFLYEIVQNHRNGIDVCKWDYMARDCQSLGIVNNFDAQRYMEFARIIEVDGEKQICTRDKEAANLYNMFYTRYNLNKFAYQHPVVCGIELMLGDILNYVKDIGLIKFNGSYSTIFDCMKDMSAFACLTDEVLTIITNTTITTNTTSAAQTNLQEAVNLIERLHRRDIYRCICESPPMSKEHIERVIGRIDGSKLTEINAKFKKKLIEKIEEIETSEIVVQTTYLDFGMRDENPISRLRVYEKSKPNDGFKLEKSQTSLLLEGMNYNEMLVRVYVKFSTRNHANSGRCAAIKKAFDTIVPIIRN